MDFGYWFTKGWNIGIAGIGFLVAMVAAFLAFMLLTSALGSIVTLFKKEERDGTTRGNAGDDD